MAIDKIVFYAFSSLAIFSSLMVISAKHSVRAVLFLVLAFFACAALWMLLEAEFLAITLVLVYVGAVMVLFLFLVMMLDVDIAATRQGFLKYLPLAVILACGLMLFLAKFLGSEQFSLASVPHFDRYQPGHSNILALGKLLYTDYLLPFELAGMMLLVAIVAAISLSFRGKQQRKMQSPHQQVQVKKQDRLKIVPMEPECQRVNKT